ncbi:794a8210-e5ca-4f32-a167-c1e38f0b32be-CDS [Sclerotinia trifoliorum]|uniref:794a8210-e5ca-4f32-a167-c1e38f0b32be-CDS n=1 Tax=Sclerotinia trifoliorum TaxID=28548 RepID=A0A8H2ZLM0_9HELO|nr:794a8210-e5ca-4f32-a167-c1e38f0b32be-CDS [Sclerotinia trifoliorum]
MPPKRNPSTSNPQNPSDLTLLFKHTTHTILLLVPTTEPFTQILTTLLSVLQERYPEGLNAASPSTSTSTSQTNRKTPLPSSIQDIALAIPLDVYDPKKGWSELQLGLGDTPESLGLKEGGLIAFRFLADGENVEGDFEGGFEVLWPSYEEYGEEGADEDGEERTGGGGEEEEEDEL